MAEPARRHRVMGLFSDDKQRSAVARNLAQRSFQQFADDNAKTLDNQSRRILEASDARQRVESDDEAEVAAAVGQLTSAATKRRGAVGLFGGKKRKQQAGDGEQETQTASAKATKKARFDEPEQSESDSEDSDEEMEEVKEQEALEASLLESDASDASDSDSHSSEKGEDEEDIDVVNDSEDEEEEEEEEEHEDADDPMGGSEEEADELPDVDAEEPEAAGQSNVSAEDESAVSEDQVAREDTSRAASEPEPEEAERSEATIGSVEASEAPVDHSLAPSDVAHDSEAPGEAQDEQEENEGSEEEPSTVESSAQQSSGTLDDSAKQSVQEEEEEEEEDATMEHRNSLQSAASAVSVAIAESSSAAEAPSDASSNGESSGQLLDDLPSESRMTSQTLTTSEIERILDGCNTRMSESTAVESSAARDHSLAASAVSSGDASSAGADTLESALEKMTDYPWNLLDPQNASRVAV